LSLYESPLGESLDLGHESERDGDAKVRLEEQLLELLERSRRHTAARQYRHVHQRDVLDALPQRALGDVAGFTK